MRLIFDHEPSTEELKTALENVPAWPGAKKTLGTDYLDFVMAVEQSKQVNNEWVKSWSPYVMVDGRIRMFMDAHIEAGKNYNEETIVPNHLPATTPEMSRFLVVGIKITSELWGIREDMAVADTSQVGVKKSADATKPYENATTSARGRAIAAFAVGLIPCGGMASAEEMMQVKSTTEAITAKEPEEAKAKVRPKYRKLGDKAKKDIEDAVADEMMTIDHVDNLPDEGLMLAIKQEQAKAVAEAEADSPEIQQKRVLVDRAKKLWDGTEEELIAAHIKTRAEETAGGKSPVNLDPDWTTWKTAEVIKLMNTAKKADKAG